mmetsp:Transcript_78159/g.155310  ORF Transcript_78159/g.155310 Transcript_78159/m.155310 type:complete len:90 (+) Transcript_78159:173-442(+)
MMAKQLSDAAAAQAKVDDANEREEANAGAEGEAALLNRWIQRLPSRAEDDIEKLIDHENEFRVDGWEFSSPHAIEREYIENNEQVVSLV